MSGNCTILGYCCILLVQIITRCALFLCIVQNGLKQAENCDLLSRRFLLECLISNHASELINGEESELREEFALDSVTIRFELDPDSLRVFMEGEFSGFYEFERDSKSEDDIE